jgi:DNA (cytosine-5)-methyltransferase 1
MEAGWLHPAPVWSDLLTFDARAWRGLVHILASGDPCQDNSVAGKREGEDGERFLAPEVVRVAEECRPDLIFRENVPGNADGQLAAITPSLERLGYRVAAGIFSSAETGNTMRRERLFIMAERKDGQWGMGARSERECLSDIGGSGGSMVPEIGLGSATGTGSLPSPLGSLHCGEEGRGPRDAEPERRSGAMGSAERSGDGRLSHDTGGGSIGRTAPDWAGDSVERQVELAGANGIGRWAEGNQGIAPDYAVQLRGRVGTILPPAVIPGPNDSRWINVLDRFPELQPALSKEEAESHVRRGFDAVAHRVERLRATGNGVDPLAAAYAFLSLDALLSNERSRAA